MSKLQLSYQRIREELVSLSVELEERTKVCELLRKRLDQERYSVRNIDDDIKRFQEEQLRALTNAHKDEMAKLIKDSSELMNRKKELINRCQELVAEVKDAESELANTILDIREDGQATLEKDKKAFKAGFEERKAKALSEKMKAVKAETRRAMDPELQRLRCHHENEMHELLARLAVKEKELRDSYDKILRDRMANEERAWKTSSQIRAREALESASFKLETMEAEHKEDMRKLSKQLTEELDLHKASLLSQTENEKNQMKMAIKRVKDDFEAQLSELRDTHRRSIEQIHDDHEEAVRRLRIHDQSARVAADRQHETDMAAASNAFKNRNTLASEGVSGSTAERDARVQAEIRRLQTETIKLERTMKVKIDNEKKGIVDAAERELENAERNFSRAQAEISELAVQKEALLAAIQKTTIERNSIQERRFDTESEISALEGDIRETENENMRRVELLALERKQQLELVMAAVEQSHQKYLSVQRMCMEQEKRQQEEIKELERRFEDTLEEMNNNVKRDVERYDREIDTLRDAVHTEKIKQEKLKKIMKSYGSS